MAGQLAVLLRDGTHSGATNKFTLQALNVAITIAKTPIQIPYPNASPELFDIGMFRPSITVSGIVPTTGATGTPFMDSVTIDGQTYYAPYKNILEWVTNQWIASDANTIELEVGNTGTSHDSTSGITPITSPFTTTGANARQSGSGHTGGGIYRVAVQQARFEFQGGEEHLWEFTLQFVGEARSDISFS